MTYPLIAPGNWLGMVGGGQLGRMFCQAAQSLGYKVAVLDPAEGSPAGVVADLHIRAAYDDPAGLAQLGARCQAVSTEFENVPAQSLDALARDARVAPAGSAVAIVQDRIREKAFIAGAGVPLAPYAEIHGAADIDAAAPELFPGILKAARLGYDGKGQARVASRQEARQAYADLGGVACVLEALMPLRAELSVVLARGYDGRCAVYPSAWNEHREGILAVSTVPTQLDAQQAELQRNAAQAAQVIAEGLDYHGVLCVEFFVLQDGRLLANEIAPRPHNSGHYTMNACVTSQFEQQARVMAGLPLGSTDSLCPAIMLNILGDVWFDPAGGARREPDWAAVLAVPGASLHLYGKAEARRGRKMGHVNVVAPTLDSVRQAAADVAAALNIPFDRAE
ncbi:5-(carboxyamino)imidazole ribonucleotide synthase [Candidimonas nitroreducens]|uniref:N5-carboxyaminoimidazole ribonucleotide synthase n=1 Tax=Candidimonas nitroreducens TaxID=683354 RepID=A0A225MT46_9BURK|nr:5-(carboxyamino)imidazole ribonucleotide synthase [Candidimonas nitroreducens]OWT61829.1 5-(carboxyamino)imidazole ribonucleotide synthase [Candidimonas nitroreducens]